MESFFLPPVAYVAFVHAVQTAHVRVPRSMHAAHNGALALYSAVVCAAVLAHWRATEAPSVCGAAPPLPPWIVRTWYWSKVWEWGDTALLVARGKRLSRLHLVHHAFTAPLVALQTWRRPTPPPLYAVGTFLNALVHAVMYAYFARPHPRLRPWVTRLQVAQHGVMCACLAYSVCDVPCVRDATHNLAPLAFYAFLLAEFGALTASR